MAVEQHDQVVVEQVRRFVDVGSSYRLFDTDGATIGRVERVGQSALDVLARLLSDLDRHLPVTLEVHGADGATELVVSKPWFRRRVEVARGDGTPVGVIQKQLRVGKSRFVLEGVDGAALGEVHAEDWRSRRFSVVDAGGTQVAAVSKQWRGLVTEAFTDADTYVVDLGGAQGDLRTMALAASVAVDLVLREDG